MIFDALEKVGRRNIPVIIEAELNKDAHAKSHRKENREYIFY